MKRLNKKNKHISKVKLIIILGERLTKLLTLLNEIITEINNLKHYNETL